MGIITKVVSENTGGGVWVDLCYLKTGETLVISWEGITLYAHHKWLEQEWVEEYMTQEFYFHNSNWTAELDMEMNNESIAERWWNDFQEDWKESTIVLNNGVIIHLDDHTNQVGIYPPARNGETVRNTIEHREPLALWQRDAYPREFIAVWGEGYRNSMCKAVYPDNVLNAEAGRACARLVRMDFFSYENGYGQYLKDVLNLEVGECLPIYASGNHSVVRVR